jgi:hypothetical protein
MRPHHHRRCGAFAPRTMVTAPPQGPNGSTRQASGPGSTADQANLPTVHTETVTAGRASGHEVQVLPAPRTHQQHTANHPVTASQASHLVAQMPPEMQPPPFTPNRKMITISVFVLVEGRKRRDSNPRTLTGLSLSRSSTPRSAVTTTAQWAGRPSCTVISGSHRSRANATTNATTAVHHWDVRRPPVC